MIRWVFLSVLLHGLSGLCQPTLPYFFNYGNFGQEDFLFFTQMADDYYFIGTTSSTQEGLTDVFLTKTDSQLNNVTTTIFGNATVDNAVGAVSDGQFIYVLSNRWNIETAYDPIISAIDTDGAVLWQINIGGTGWELGAKIRFHDGNLFAVGKSNSGVFLTILDTDGLIINTFEKPSPGFSVADFVVVNDLVHMVGENTNPAGSATCPSLFTLNLSNGFFQEMFNAGISGKLNFISRNGDVLVAAGRILDSAENAEVFYAVDFTIGGIVQNQVTFIAEGEIVDALVKEDRYVFAAYNSTFAYAQNDIFLFQTNFLLEYAGAYYFDSQRNEIATGLFTNTAGDYLVTGKSNSHDGPDYNAHVVFVGDIPVGESSALNPQGLVLLGNTLEIDSPDLKKGGFVIYPNPCVGDVVHFSEQLTDIIVRDVSGKVMFIAPGSAISVGLGQLDSGVFLISGTLKNGEIAHEKVLVKRY